eukprot:5246595-Amphidinium_carterae.1
MTLVVVTSSNRLQNGKQLKVRNKISYRDHIQAAVHARLVLHISSKGSSYILKFIHHGPPEKGGMTTTFVSSKWGFGCIPEVSYTSVSVLAKNPI